MGRVRTRVCADDMFVCDAALRTILVYIRIFLTCVRHDDFVQINSNSLIAASSCHEIELMRVLLYAVRGRLDTTPPQPFRQLAVSAMILRCMRITGHGTLSFISTSHC
jgi:hypothetical protein